MVVFTDGFCDVDGPAVRAGMGAWIYDPASQCCEFWGALIPQELVNLLRLTVHSDQIVGQSELLPCLGARLKWPQLLRGRPVLHFIDNDAARFGLIRGYSPSRPSACIISDFWTAEAELGCRSWFDRVPSASNPSDGPSRIKFEEIPSANGVRPRQVAPPAFCAKSLESIRKQLKGVAY